MAAECGCHGGYIENGIVATSSCHTYSSPCNSYCLYYCNHGYTKTVSSVYCAGNERWVPTGSHPSQNKEACRKSTAPYDACDDIFIENGYIVSCLSHTTSSRKECLYQCYRGYRPTSNTAFCNKDGWVPSDSMHAPCVGDGEKTTLAVPTHRPTQATGSTPPVARTTYPGYYDDPHLKMDISPVIFVAAVIGGIIILGLLVFAIFFRAHRKSTREARRRAAFNESCVPFSQQNINSNYHDNCPLDDSEFRETARRIIAQSSNQQQQNVPISAPPYEGNPPTNVNRFGNVPYSGLPIPPYTVVHDPVMAVPDTVQFQSTEHQQIPQINRNVNAIDSNTEDGTEDLADKPPPYESLPKDMTSDASEGFNQMNIIYEELDPPPPYTVHGTFD